MRLGDVHHARLAILGTTDFHDSIVRGEMRIINNNPVDRRKPPCFHCKYKIEFAMSGAILDHPSLHVHRPNLPRESPRPKNKFGFGPISLGAFLVGPCGLACRSVRRVQSQKSTAGDSGCVRFEVGTRHRSSWWDCSRLSAHGRRRRAEAGGDEAEETEIGSAFFRPDQQSR